MGECNEKAGREFLPAASTLPMVQCPAGSICAAAKSCVASNADFLAAKAIPLDPYSYRIAKKNKVF